MDLTVALMENPQSNGERNGAEDGGTIDSKRAKFMETYDHQNFSIPDSFVLYIAKNPKSWKLYRKMVKTCKFFFVKNEILVIDKPLSYYESQWTDAETPYDMNQTISKLWIAYNLYVRPRNSIFAETKDQNILTSITPKLYRCDVRCLSLFNQVISYQDLMLLTSSAKRICFYEVVVKHENGSDVDLQHIVETASNATCINVSHPTITSKTMEELLKIPNFPTIRFHFLRNIPQVFDIESFYVHMKKNKTTRFHLVFDESISDEYMKRLLDITDEIIATKELDFKPPLFDFRGLDYARYKKLNDIFNSEKKNF